LILFKNRRDLINKMNMIELVIEIVIFTALIGTIATQITSGGNLTGAALVMYGLIYIIFMYNIQENINCCCWFHRLSYQKDGLEKG